MKFLENTNIQPLKEFIFNVQGEQAVPSGDDNVILCPPTWVPVGLTLKLERYCGYIGSGTSATITIKQKTLAASSFTTVASGLSADTTENGNEGTLSSNNSLAGGSSGAWYVVGIEVTAVSSTPTNMVFTVSGTYEVSS